MLVSGNPLFAIKFVPSDPPGLYTYWNCHLSTALASPINFLRFSLPDLSAFSFFLFSLAVFSVVIDVEVTSSCVLLSREVLFRRRVVVWYDDALLL